MLILDGVTLQVEEATLPSSKSDEKPAVKQSTRTRSSKRQRTEESPSEEEAPANGAIGDATEDHLQVSG